MPDSEVRFVRVAAVRGPLQGSPTPSLREHRFVRDPNAQIGGDEDLVDEDEEDDDDDTLVV